jgi:NAD(P)H-nitrite reductase large subunit
MRYRSDDFYTDNNIRLVTGREVVSIDSQTKDIVLDDENGCRTIN